VGGQHHALVTLPPGKTQYLLYRRLGGPQGWSGRVRKISLPPGFFFCSRSFITLNQAIHACGIYQYVRFSRLRKHKTNTSSRVNSTSPNHQTPHAETGEDTCPQSLFQYAKIISHQFPPTRLCIQFPLCPLQKVNKITGVLSTAVCTSVRYHLC
jgi:hypothetical protein